jgi:Tfp pilus assembly protein PilN
MTTTDEMAEKLMKENEQLQAEIKEIDEMKKPKEQQLKMNKKVLTLIKQQKLGQNLVGKRKYTKKQKNEQID